MPVANGISCTCKSTVYNVKDYAAQGDGKKLDSRAINKAIKAVADAGGSVYPLASNYLSGSIRLKNNISLCLEQGATIIATSEEGNGAYDPEEAAANTVYQGSGHSHFHNSLIWGEDSTIFPSWGRVKSGGGVY